MRPAERWAVLREGLIPLLLMLPLVWALLPGGVPNTADGKVHFLRAAEMIHAWQDGVLLPRWSQHMGFGYGIPLFVYTPPLPSFLTAGLVWLGLAPEAAYKGMLLAGVVVAVYGGYWLGRSLLGVWAGAVTAAAFLYTPFFLRELTIQGNAAQFLAWSFTPWAAAAVIQLYRAPRGRYVVILALALVGTLLSHNAVALLAAGLTAGLGLILFAFTRAARGLAATAAGGLLGVALSSWFSLPALLEGKYVALDRIVASDFRARFVPLAELLAWSPRLDTAAINPYVPLTLGVIQVAAALLGVVGWLVLVTRARPSPFLSAAQARLLIAVGLAMTLTAAFGAWMATRWSAPLWDLLPFVNLFEFPARWHGVTALGMSWLGGAAVAGIAALAPRPLRGLLESVMGSALLLLLLLVSSIYLYPQKLSPGAWRIDPAEVVRFEVKSAVVGSTSLGEFNPRWIETPLRTSALVDDYAAGAPINRLPDPLPPGVRGEVLENSVQRYRFRLDLDAPATLTIRLHYFPGWQATANGKAIALRPHPGDGLIDVDLPAGESTLTIRFAGTPLRRAAALVSALAWIGLAAGMVFYSARRGRAATPQPMPYPLPYPLRGVMLGVASVAGLALLVHAVAPQWFLIHSPPDRALPAQVTLRADFGDRLRLLGVDPPPQVAAPGEQIGIVAYWRAVEPLEIDYAVFLHLDDPVSGETLITVDQTHPSDIPTSGWATGQYVRNPLRLTIPADAPPIQYVLRVGFYDPATGERLSVASDAAPEGEIGRIWVEPPQAPRPPDGPHIRFGESLELLGAAPDPDAGAITFYWRTHAPLAADYTIFVHLLDGTGQMIGQVDGAPYANRYPLSAWRPGQIVEDRRVWSSGTAAPGSLQRIAVGVYDPTSGLRLAAVDDQGQRLAEDALILSWPR